MSTSTPHDEQFPVREAYSHEAEQALIASLLIDGSAITLALDIVAPDDFHNARNRLCYEACLELFHSGRPIDGVTLVGALNERQQLESVGGSEYISSLRTPTSLHIPHYARTIRDAAHRRRMAEAGRQIYELGLTSTDSVELMFGNAVDLLFKVQPSQADHGLVPLSNLYDAYLQGDRELDDPQYGRPLPTHYPDLDQLLGGGVRRSDLIILGARPSLGKSSLAFNIAINAAKDGAVCALFNLEMSNEQVAQRILASESGVPAMRIQTQLYTVAQEEALVQCIGSLSSLSAYSDDTPYQTVAQMRSKAQRLQMEIGLDLVVVDYLQLISDSDRRRGNRVEQITEISRHLKGLARDLNVPVLACSQLSRQLENRPNHRPQLSDLRDSGSIEQDADVVMFLHREDHFATEEEWQRQYPGQPYPRNIAELIIAKHRHGPTGQFNLYFRQELMRFESLQRTDDP